MEKWYVIRTATNKEKECKEKIENQIKYTNIETLVKRLVIPFEKVVQLRKGKKIITTRNHYPGYILIECDETALGELTVIFKPINYVIGFLGRPHPIALKQHEIDGMLGRMDELQGVEPIIINKFIKGETIKVIDGPFKDFIGKVVDYNEEKSKLKINVLVFGRDTPIDLNPLQVSKEY